MADPTILEIRIFREISSWAKLKALQLLSKQ